MEFKVKTKSNRVLGCGRFQRCNLSDPAAVRGHQVSIFVQRSNCAAWIPLFFSFSSRCVEKSHLMKCSPKATVCVLFHHTKKISVTLGAAEWGFQMVEEWMFRI